MTQPYTEDDEKLILYLEAESKYFIVPIPTLRDRAAAIGFVSENVTVWQTVEKMRKLVRLAISYDLQETVPTFLSLLNGHENEPADYQRSALAVIALGWIANDAQREAAQAYLHALQDRASVQQHRQIMLEATDALGPVEGTDHHRRWVEGEIAQLEGVMRRYQKEGKQSEVRGIQMQIDELQEHLNIWAASVDKANEVRRAIQASPVEGRIPRLAALYVGATGDSTPELSFWSAMTLIRLASQGPNFTEATARAFLGLASGYEKVDAQWQAQFDLSRARCLRAASFFGQILDEANLRWLAAQKDPGTDLLASRPDWRYPSPLVK